MKYSEPALFVWNFTTWTEENCILIIFHWSTKCFALLLCGTLFYAWIMCCLEVFICYLLGVWFINLCVSLCMCVSLCTFVYTRVYPELGGACRQTCSSVRHLRSSWALPPWHLPQRSETGNRQVTVNAFEFMCDRRSTRAKVNHIFFFFTVLGPWVVLWIVWCLSHHGGVPLCRPSCKSR